MAAPEPQTISEQNKHLIIRWFDEVWVQSNRKTIYELYGKDCTLHDGKTTYRGPDEFCRFYDLLKSQFSDFSISPIVELAEADLACLHFSVECTHIRPPLAFNSQPP